VSERTLERIRLARTRQPAGRSRPPKRRPLRAVVIGRGSPGGIVLLATLAALAAPSLRAVRVDPTTGLRAE